MTFRPYAATLVLFLAACGCRTDSATVRETRRSELDYQLIRGVIQSEVLTLLDPAKDKSPVFWRDWWYTVSDNLGEPPPDVLAVFRKAGFNINDPPPRPANYPSYLYEVRRLKRLDSQTLEADVGPSYFGCTYRFKRAMDEWIVDDRFESKNCWIS